MTAQLQSDIIRFRPLYEEAARILACRIGYNPPIYPEVAGTIDFGGKTYSGKSLSPENRQRLHEIDAIFKGIRSRNPELSRVINLGDEYPFTYKQTA